MFQLVHTHSFLKDPLGNAQLLHTTNQFCYPGTLTWLAEALDNFEGGQLHGHVITVRRRLGKKQVPIHQIVKDEHQVSLTEQLGSKFVCSKRNIKLLG